MLKSNGKMVVVALAVLFMFATSVRFANAADTVATAKVLSATERVVQQCTQVQYQQPQAQQESIGNSVVPALLGSVAGGYLGNQIGGGQGRVIATSVGATTGAVLGAQYGRASASQPHASAPAQQQCSYQTIGYEVTYDLNGVIGKGFVPYRPGGSINVGLTVM